MKSKYSAEEKLQIVMEPFADNVTQAEIRRRHGIFVIIESFVLNVYSVQNIKNGDTEVDTGAGIGGCYPCLKYSWKGR
jgi:hypothetical protein